MRPSTAHFQHLDDFGWVFISEFCPQLDTEAIARECGRVVRPSVVMPGSRIPDVQRFSPRPSVQSPANMYSGTYGMDDFPLHTDLAHWIQPPRYMILRCIVGSPLVDTLVLPAEAMMERVGVSLVRRAVMRPRRRSRSNHLVGLPMSFGPVGARAIRWDSLFLVPVNAAAKQIASNMKSPTTEQQLRAIASRLSLTAQGDTLIIDNWRALHGRTSAPDTAICRTIDRAYLSEVQS